MTLTQNNYYSEAANRKWMSKSQFHSFATCEFATMAELNGMYKPDPSTALLVGGYVDSAIDGPEALEAFKAEHPEILNSRTGELKADFKQAEQIVERIKSDRLMSLLTGNTPETKDHVTRQEILVGEIGGVSFRGKADFILDEQACKTVMDEFPNTADVLGGMFTEGAILDLKTTKDFAPVWVESNGCKMNWIDAWDYTAQGAIYQELYRQKRGKTLPFLIVAATKEKNTDIAALYIPQSELDASLHIVEDNAPIFDKVKKGLIEPVRCECCAYCRATKKLTEIKNYKEI